MPRLTFALGLSLAVVVLFAGSAVLGLELVTRDRVLPGVRILGVALGGLSVDEASARLQPRAAALLDQQVEVQFGDRSWRTTARGLGLQLDPNDLAQTAFRVGRDGPPLQLLGDQLELLRSGADITVSRTAAGSEVDAFLGRIATELDRPPGDAQLSLDDDGSVTFAASHTGLQVDQPASREQVAMAFATGQPTVNLVTRTVEPAVTTDQVAAAHEQLERILAGDARVNVRAAEKAWTLERSELLALLDVHPPAAPRAAAAVALKDEPLQAFIDQRAVELRQEPLNARFSFSNGSLKPVRQSRDGRALDKDAALQLLRSQLLLGQRAVELPIIAVRPAVSSEDATSLDIRELIDESSTSFVGSVAEKAHNIALAAERLNGVVVPPGGTFSFNKEVGPTTLEAGFQWGFGLTTGPQGGVHTVPSVAGGICQVATTLFQPVFWAGYQLEERYWHLYWIPNYTSRGTVGLDATVDADSNVDFKWINPTSDAVLIQSSTGPDRVTFRLYGKKPPWTVRVEEPVVSNRVAPDPSPEVQEEPLLRWGRVVPVETARDGFQVVLVRHVLPEGGAPARDLALKSIYGPAHNVTLVGTANAPDAGSVAAAVARIRDSQRPAVAAAVSPSVSPTPAPSAPSYNTPNGSRTLAQIRDELRRAGWGGGSDQDALETYNRVAAAAQ